MNEKDPDVASEEFRYALGELLLEEDWMREKYLEPYEKFDADKRAGLYDELRSEMHRRLAHMRELVAKMQTQLKVIGGGVK